MIELNLSQTIRERRQTGNYYKEKNINYVAWLNCSLNRTEKDEQARVVLPVIGDIPTFLTFNIPKRLVFPFNCSLRIVPNQSAGLDRRLEHLARYQNINLTERDNNSNSQWRMQEFNRTHRNEKSVYNPYYETDNSTREWNNTRNNQTKTTTKDNKMGTWNATTTSSPYEKNETSGDNIQLDKRSRRGVPSKVINMFIWYLF